MLQTHKNKKINRLERLSREGITDKWTKKKSRLPGCVCVYTLVSVCFPELGVSL